MTSKISNCDRIITLIAVMCNANQTIQKIKKCMSSKVVTREKTTDSLRDYFMRKRIIVPRHHWSARCRKMQVKDIMMCVDIYSFCVFLWHKCVNSKIRWIWFRFRNISEFPQCQHMWFFTLVKTWVCRTVYKNYKNNKEVG